MKYTVIYMSTYVNYLERKYIAVHSFIFFTQAYWLSCGLLLYA